MGTCADWDLWIRLSRVATPAGVTRPLVGYRIHSSNMSLDTRRTIAELAEIEQRYGGPIDWGIFYRHLARVSLRSGRHIQAVQDYRRAARVDGHYRRRDFLMDLIEVAQDAGRRLPGRLARSLNVSSAPTRAARPSQRYAAQWAWVETARPWLDELARLQRHLQRPV